MTQAHKERMAKLARLHQRRAEIDAEIAVAFAEMAEGETVDLRSGRRRQRPHRAELPVVSEMDRARAQAALRENEHRRRVRG